MFSRLGLMFAMAVAIGMLGLGLGQREASAADKVVTLNPTSGIVGTVVTAELFNAPANDPITVIFKIPGDPILTTGTTDANGYAKFTFTIPYVPGGGTYPVFFTDFKCSCQIATDFTVINSRPTPTTQPSATPTRPATQPPSTATPLPTATPSPTPGVPVLGTTPPGGGLGPNIGVLGLGFLAVLVVLAWFTATRRGPSQAAFALVEPDDFGPDYSTELDLPTLDSLRRPRTVRTQRAPNSRRGLAWAATAAGAAIAGLVLLRKK